MIKLIRKISVVIIILGLFLGPAHSSYASPGVFEVEAILSPPAPAAVGESTPILASVNFDISFSSIELVCFSFHFQTDLLDLGDELFFGPFISGSGFGYRHGSSNPRSELVLCLTSVHAESSLFLDGQQDFGIVMESGSVIIESLTVQIYGIAQVDVEIDIKAGIEPNNLYCSGGELVRRGVFDVAILTTDTFDATSVDHTTVTFEGAGEIHFDWATGVPRRHEVDVDHDGDIDLLFHFRLGETDLSCDSTEGVLIGETFDGFAIQGTDSVRMVNYGR